MSRPLGRLLLAFALAASWGLEAAAADSPAGLPATIEGGQVVHTAVLSGLVQGSGALPIDVLPLPRRPEGLPAGSPWLLPPHLDIPGSAWLPGLGEEWLSPSHAAALDDRLRSLTGGDKARALVFYCHAGCRRSLDAARQAIAWGYSRVFWYPDGLEAWMQAGEPTEAATPIRVKGDPQP